MSWQISHLYRVFTYYCLCICTFAEYNGIHEKHPNDIKVNDVVDDKTWREKEDELQYRHLSDEDQDNIDAVLRGYQPLDNMPRLNSRVVKVFISSTFTGRWLFGHVYYVTTPYYSKMLIQVQEK